MKKCFIFTAIVVLICTLGACSQSGRDKYIYRDVEGGKGLHRYNGTSSNETVLVPDEVDGQKVVELMDFCIANSEHIKTINIGANVKTISPWALANCKQLEKITADAANPFFEADEFGVLFTKGKTELVCYPNAREKLKKDSGEQLAGGGEYKIPAGVKKIRNNAFYLCDNLYRVTFNEGLVEIGDAAFMKCAALQNFILPESLEIIGKDSFSFCDALTTVTIPRNVTIIGDYAFFSQASLIKTITLKRPIEEIQCGKDWLPSIKNSANTKVQAVYAP
jgi:hypothetical protein